VLPEGSLLVRDEDGLRGDIIEGGRCVVVEEEDPTDLRMGRVLARAE